MHSVTTRWSSLHVDLYSKYWCNWKQHNFVCSFSGKDYDRVRVSGGSSSVPGRMDYIQPAPYKLDIFLFSDINECERYGMCPQDCKNSKGSYECFCAEGFRSVGDEHGKQCAAEGREDTHVNPSTCYHWLLAQWCLFYNAFYPSMVQLFYCDWSKPTKQMATPYTMNCLAFIQNMCTSTLVHHNYSCYHCTHRIYNQ